MQRRTKLILGILAFAMVGVMLSFFLRRDVLEEDALMIAEQVAQREFCERSDAYRGMDLIFGRYDWHPQQRERFQGLYDDHRAAIEAQLSELSDSGRASYCQIL